MFFNHQSPLSFALFAAMTICLREIFVRHYFRRFARIRISPIPPTGDKAPVLTPLPMFIPPCYIIFACFLYSNILPSSLTQLTVSPIPTIPCLGILFIENGIHMGAPIIIIHIVCFILMHFGYSSYPILQQNRFR